MCLRVSPSSNYVPTMQERSKSGHSLAIASRHERYVVVVWLACSARQATKKTKTRKEDRSAMSETRAPMPRVPRVVEKRTRRRKQTGLRKS